VPLKAGARVRGAERFAPVSVWCSRREGTLTFRHAGPGDSDLPPEARGPPQRQHSATARPLALGALNR
jgi:hypothetical protein